MQYVQAFLFGIDETPAKTPHKIVPSTNLPTFNTPQELIEHLIARLDSLRRAKLEAEEHFEALHKESKELLRDAHKYAHRQERRADELQETLSETVHQTASGAMCVHAQCTAPGCIKKPLSAFDVRRTTKGYFVFETVCKECKQERNQRAQLVIHQDKSDEELADTLVAMLPRAVVKRVRVAV